MKGEKLPLDLKRAAALHAEIRAKREEFARRFVPENWNLMIDGDTTNMKTWKLETIGDCVQTKECNSFIGGKPKLPPDMDILKCELCGKKMAFMFQVAFPQGHAWAGKSMAVFYCVESWHDRYCIPELPQHIVDADIPEQFLSNYERNFRVLVFGTSLGKMVDAYQEKVVFQALQTVPEKQTKQEWDFVIGGRPIWIMRKSEEPNTIAGIEKPVLLLQVKEELHFSILPTASKQANPFAPGGLSLFPWYELFAGNRIYFWGVQSNGTEWVYISVQCP